jgi:hypothetical protein
MRFGWRGARTGRQSHHCFVSYDADSSSPDSSLSRHRAINCELSRRSVGEIAKQFGASDFTE